MDGFEIGYNTIRHTGASGLFDGISREFVAFTSPGDAVTTLPPGATVTARNEYGIHAFEVDQVCGVQFHPEFDVQTAVEITRKKPLSPGRRAAVLAGITPQAAAAAVESTRVFSNFIRTVRTVRTDSPSFTGPSAPSPTAPVAPNPPSVLVSTPNPPPGEYMILERLIPEPSPMAHTG